MKNRTIVITGASGNMGLYFISKYISQNNLILIDFKKSDKVKKIIKEVNTVKFIKVDITDFQDLNQKISDLLIETNWKPDTLIHTAAIRSSDSKSLIDTDPEFWQKIIQVNLIGTYHLLKIIIPYFKKHKFGRIILFGSNVSRIGLKNGTAYSASKAAIANLTRSLAQEISDENILINTISPGPIKMRNDEFSKEYNNFREKYFENERKQIPLKRIAEPDDLFSLCEFLLSEKNTYLTGEEIFVTGGKL
ncbi:MAG: SDR family oxidoreductase [Candidatus Cloacimonetes bacterium]|nr:SDR family oxidoreductase [Candidatus Cloacimonadota bacterium]